MVWSRRGRVRIAVLGSALALAAGGVAAPAPNVAGPADDEPPAAQAPTD